MTEMRFGDNGVALERLVVSAYTVPTDLPESDGTYSWDKTTMVLVEAYAGDACGLGYTYADAATGKVIQELLEKVVVGCNVMNISDCWLAMVQSIRNLGRPGIASMAIAAVDSALWDLKARLLDLPLVSLLGAVRESALIYGSGGFTSYSREHLQGQLGGWVEQGIPRVKMKVGTDSSADPRRVAEAREAIGADTELFVDANGAYSRKEALASPRSSPPTTALPGLRNRSPPTIWQGCTSSAIVHQQEWISQQVNMAMTCGTSDIC